MGFWWMTASLVAMGLSLFGEPKGFRLISGDATPPQCTSPQGWTVQSVGSTIIQWDQFSLAETEHFVFHQAAAGSGVLNRVVGGGESRLLGMLSSNGPVYLINCQGVLIGPNARIETAGFIASSLDVLDAAFLEGKQLLFSGSGKGSLVNLGTIQCESGDVVLLGRHVETPGTIEASAGQVGLGVGTEILLQPRERPFILIRSAVSVCPCTKKKTGAALEQTGVIRALEVELRAFSNAYVKAIQSSGTIEALGVERKGGEVFLVAEGGACVARGKILAGDGAPGRRTKGGFIEVSGPQIDVGEDLLAEQVLLDPTDILISTESNSGGSWNGGDFNPSAATSVINTTTLQNLLGSGNVMVSTSSNYSAPEGGMITVSNPVTWSAATTLSLIADAGVAINAAVTNTSNQAGFTAIVLTGQGTSEGSYSGVAIGSNLDSSGGDIYVTGVGSPADGTNHGVAIEGGRITSTAGHVYVNGAATKGHGLFMDNGVVIAAGGPGTVTVQGTSRINDMTLGCGVFMTGSGTAITAGQGTLTVSGSTDSWAPLASGIYLSGGASQARIQGDATVNVTALHGTQMVLTKGLINSTGGYLNVKATTINVNP